MLHFLFSTFLVCSCRLVFSAYMQLACKQKEYFAIQRDTAFWDRWFFTSVAKAAKDRYSKSEKRIIPYAKHAKAFQITNILHHILLLIEGVFWVVTATAIGDSSEVKCLAEKISVLLYCAIGSSFLVFAIVTGLENQQYHKKRVSKKKG